MVEVILAVGLVVGISAVCSLTEAVLYSVSWTNIEQLKKSGRSSGELLEKLRQNVDQPITAILTLNTVANTAGAAIAGAAAVKVFGEGSLLWFSALLTGLILIFSEILPKTVGVVFSRSLAPVLALPLTLLVRLFLPLIWILRLLVGFVGSKKEQLASEEDLLAYITLSRRTGAIDQAEALSMSNILSMDKKVVKDIMTPRTVIFSLPANITVSEARGEGLWPHSRVPVYDAQNPEDIIGIVFRREMLEALAEDKDEETLGNLMRPVQFVLENLSLDRLLLRFLDVRTHLFVVLDEYGGLAGVVSLEDVLEEILGREIVDETDQVVDMREYARQQRRQLVEQEEHETK